MTAPAARLAASTLLLAALLPGAGLRAPVAAAPLPTPLAAASAVVVEILDGDQLYIDTHQAHPRERALSPQQVRTEASRGQLRFDNGASGRLNRFSRIRLGSTCFLLGQGEVLISGRQSGCTRSSRLSVRGTNYVLAVEPSGEAVVKVLEGEVQLHRLRDGAPVEQTPVPLQAGQKARLSAEGLVRAISALSAAEVADLLAGPLFRGFRTPLADQAGLQQALQRLYPGLKAGTPPPAPPSAPPDPLTASINAARTHAGRPPLQVLPAALAQQNSTYLRPVLEQVLSSNNCDHDLARWQAIQAETAQQHASLIPTSEVIACPRGSGQWNPTAIVSQWLTSPLHTGILLNRPRATHIGCVRLDRGGRTVAMCTLWSPAAP
ncbi:hypothetical protein NZK32_01770 [Cyanobium sp. FGCU-52]|nr:hypothetical protein [Cyanobium sp. FGCU52]